MDPDDLPLDEDFGDEDFTEEADQYDGNDDDTDPSGEGGDGQHQAEPGENEELADGQREPVRQPSRAERRVQSALQAANEAKERADALEAQIRQLTEGQGRVSREQEEQERLARMDPYERAEYVAQRAERNTQGLVNQLRQEMADNTDKAGFAAKCASNPTLAKISDEVERTLSELRRTGSTAPRETVAAFLIGQKVLAKAPAARSSASKRAAERTNRERARPSGGGSDVTGGRTRDERAARLERLESASI